MIGPVHCAVGCCGCHAAAACLLHLTAPWLLQLHSYTEGSVRLLYVTFAESQTRGGYKVEENIFISVDTFSAFFFFNESKVESKNINGFVKFCYIYIGK